MEKTKNFLDILKTELDKMVEDGIISEQQINNGLEISEDWLFSNNIKRRDLETTIVSILCSRSKSYFDRCKFKGKNPNKPGVIRISKANDSIKVSFVGNDEWSKFIITNKKEDKTKLLQLYPIEFINQLYNTIKERQTKQMLQQLGIDFNSLAGNLSTIEDSQSRRAFKTGLNLGLIEMSENFIKYYRYLIEEEKINKEYIEKQKEAETSKEMGNNQDETDIETVIGGVIEMQQDRREGPRNNTGRVYNPRINAKIDFEDRDKFFKSMRPEKIITYKAFTEENEIIQSHNVYLYSMEPKGNGYLMVCEPYSGERSARLVNLPIDVINDLIIDGKQMDNDFWIEISQYYLQMSNDEFRGESRTSTINHTSFENYIQTVQLLINSERNGTRPENISTAAILRAKRIRSKLFEGEKALNIKALVADVTLAEVEELRKVLGEDKRSVNFENETSEQSYEEEELK